MSGTVQDKRDGLDLTVLFKTDDAGGRAVVRTFEAMLSDYLVKLLDPGLSDADALWVRAKAVALVETLDLMGVKMSAVSEAPIRKVARMRMNQSLETNWAE